VRPSTVQAAVSEPAAVRAAPTLSARVALLAQAAAAAPSAPPKVEPAPLTSGVIETQPLAVIPGSSEPMKPVKVKTVQVKAGPLKLASAAPSQPAPPVTSAIPTGSDVAETSNAVVARAENVRAQSATAEDMKAELPQSDTIAERSRIDLPQQPPGHGTGNGILGVLPASSIAQLSAPRAIASIAPSSQSAPTLAQSSAAKPATVHTGWIVQVGALDSESEAQQRIEAARSQAHGLLSKADPFTEPVIAKGDHKLFRARFAGLDRDQAEAVCRALKRSEISCITVRN
jgi:D-alanyl-D-alanine carboxypeptidase